LRHSQQELTDFVENAPIGMHWVAADGRILWVNQAELDLLGYAREEYIDHSIVEFHTDQAIIEDILCRLANNETLHSYEARLRCKDGSIRHVLIDSNVLRENGEFIHTRCFTRDITARKQTELSLQESLKSLEFQKFALDRAAIVAITDRHGVITYVNEQFCQISKYSREELLGQTHRIINSHHHPPKFFRKLWSTISSGKVWEGEIKNKAKDGSFYWVWTTIVPFSDSTGKPFQYLAIRFDVSPLKSVEESLRESEKRFRSLSESSPMGIFQADTQGQYTYANARWQSMSGLTLEQSLGKGWMQSIYREDRAVIFTQWQDCVREKSDFSAEFRLIKPDGELRWISTRAAAIANEDGEAIGFVGTHEDISDKKSLEQQFLHAQRLESLGTLAGGIAHDLNNILTPILAAAQLLPLTLPNLDERNQRIVQMLVDSSRRGSNLVQQILSFARGMDGQRTLLQVGHLLAEVISIIRQTFPRNIEIERDILTRELWTVSADATQLHQVFMNLCVNARDAMPDGGTLSITAENLLTDENYARMNLEAHVGPYVVITISDTGFGMAPHVIEHIFAPFFTTKKEGKGTGLGLSTVMGIIKSHGGFINVYSEVGTGSYFKVYLPATESAVPAHFAEDAANPLRGNGELILTVDDETSIREITKISLEAFNYQVITAKDGVEALALFAKQYQEISFVLLDLMMPSLDSATIIRTLQTIDPQVQIITMSGLATSESLVSSMSQNVRAFLAKPFTAQDLLQTLHSLKNSAPE
jgi:two-component system, cell cycle sensor histidine kinase and response regulator CckA